MCVTIVLLPLLGFLLTNLFGEKLGSKGSIFVTISSMFSSFFISIFLIFEIGILKSPVYLIVCSWIKLETLNVNWGFLFDELTVVMCFVVTLISSLVHLYSVEYMSNDPHLTRFMSLLSLFTFFMLILVTADNFVQMFLGWEGVGLCSYLLINFWFTRIQANKSAVKAIIYNRVGDFFLMLGILTIFVFFKTLDYSTAAAVAPLLKNYNINFFLFNLNLISFICVLIFIGCMGKSAQIGLHSWLPDAMEGPTPVSALIHAATMVTAGVYLIIRCSFIFEYSEIVLNFIAITGTTTALFAASVGLVQNDVKKVVAYSTCSQLGYMMLSCGFSDYSASAFHLSNHAFFKALLFLTAGMLIHSVNDEQDVRKMGGLKKILPFSYSSMVIGSLALTSFPFLSGFYSKDCILEHTFSSFETLNYYCYIVGTITAFITSFYSIRLICLIFLVKPNGHKSSIGFSDETRSSMTVAVLTLIFPTIFIGYCTKDAFVGFGTDFFNSVIYINPSKYNRFESEFSSNFLKNLPFLFSIFGTLTSYITYIFYNSFLSKFKRSNQGKKIYLFLNKKWYFDKLFYEIWAQFFFKSSYSHCYKKIDRGSFEMVGPQGLFYSALKTTPKVHESHTKYIYQHIIFALLAISFLFCFFGFMQYLNCFLDYRLFFLILLIFIRFSEISETN